MKDHILIEKAFRYPTSLAEPVPSNSTYQHKQGYWTINSTGTPLMQSEDARPSQSKKCDIETGEDQKGE